MSRQENMSLSSCDKCCWDLPHLLSWAPYFTNLASILISFIGLLRIFYKTCKRCIQKNMDKNMVFPEDCFTKVCQEYLPLAGETKERYCRSLDR